MSKPQLSPEAVQVIVERDLGVPCIKLEPSPEGEESQVFTFEQSGRARMLRINPSAEGFRKDKLAQERFGSPEVPIPRVLKIGQIDNSHAYCVSEQAPGVTLQDSDSTTVKKRLKPTADVLGAIGNTDISWTRGYGAFDSTGAASYGSWREVLHSLLDPQRHDWESVRARVRSDYLDSAMEAYGALCAVCPEERQLVHGDFGANNVLTDGEGITAVVDWENAMYGDHLFDVATAYFWRTWLTCMELQAAYFETELANLPNYRERLSCYQLRIGLWDVYDNVTEGDLKMADWALNRCREVISAS